MSEQAPKFEKGQAKETGRKVLLILKVIRHGERTKDGELTDYGRTVTRQKAGEAALPEVSGGKAVGSPFKPKESLRPPRSLETADIYIEELFRAGRLQKKYATRARQILNPESLKTPPPFDWIEFYNSQLPADFEALSDEQKAEASHKAQTACVDRVLTMEGTAEFNQEIAGSFAFFIDNYLRLVEELKDGSRILYVAGSHGGLMEPFLQECLIRKNRENQIKRGFERLEEIGGAFRPSEAFNVIIETDEQGERKVSVNFDDPSRLPGETMTLDLEKIKELAEEYTRRHGVHYKNDA